MADVHPLPEICCLKNSNILVHVEEALLDFLVVTFEYDSKLYQGVLLDTTNRCLPCGISAPPGFPEMDAPQHGLGNDEDKMYNVAQRYSYFQETSPPHVGAVGKDSFAPGFAYHMRRAMRGGQSKFKSSRMTVRLRPRQVLCTKCKSTCNENSENVDFSKKRKGVESSGSNNGPVEKRNCPSRQISPKSPRPPFSENPQDNKPSNAIGPGRRKNSSTPVVDTSSLGPSLIPKILNDDTVPISLDNNGTKLNIVGGFWSRQPSDSNLEAESSQSITTQRSKKSNGSTEKGPNFTTVCDASCDSHYHSTEAREPDKYIEDTCLTATSVVEEQFPFLKSSCTNGTLDMQEDSPCKLNNSLTSSEIDESQDRMVLRKKRNVGSMEDLWDESVFLEDTTRRTTPVIKISFGGTQGEGTVLKIPAKVRSYHASDSEAEDPESAQPESQSKDARSKAAKKALKKAKKEARRKTPGNFILPSEDHAGVLPSYEASLHHRRRKRKVKHKKRRKGTHTEHENDALEGEVRLDISPLMDEDPLKLDDSMPHEENIENSCDYNAMKAKCLKQKLSISLKRLATTAFANCGGMSSSAGSNSPGSNSELSGGDDLPDFPTPPSDHPFVTVSSCLTGDGRTMGVGDVVWGKIHGFPWWPGKVLSITIQKKEDNVALGPQAHVAWYGSSTSSLMPCDQLSPFLETFKTRYNKKKRGPYKEAIRQATCEAQKDVNDPLQEIDVVL